jgi:ADP-ribose pyrophosphatase YjhB (NUDIX family)
MNFCNECGAPAALRIPAGDQRPRHVCTVCGNIQYLNPKIVVGTLPIWKNQVLLCKRAIEPRLGFWTLPAGFMEIGESTREGAIRETQEEACANIALEELYTLFNLPQIGQVHMLYRARLLDLNFAPGEESLETRLFLEEEIPWEELAFQSVSVCLRHYFKDRAMGAFIFREASLL